MKQKEALLLPDPRGRWIRWDDYYGVPDIALCDAQSLGLVVTVPAARRAAYEGLGFSVLRVGYESDTLFRAAR